MWVSTSHEAVLAGPAETGKTWAAISFLNDCMWRYAGAQGAILRKTYTALHGSALATFRKVTKDGPPIRAFGGEIPQWYDYPNGSRIWVGGMDNPQKVLSSERDVIFVNQAEELALDDWETLTTRCTGRGGHMPFARIFADANPGPEKHWILGRSSLQVLESRHEDNPTLFTADGQLTEQGRRTMAVLDALTGNRYQRLRLGKWTSAEGQVYDEWDRAIHLISEGELRGLGIIE